MATGSFGGQLQSAISSRLTADPYEKRRQAAMGSYQDQAEKSRKDLSERLNRLGVLRGGGATASQFGEFESGVLRGQQALDAQFEAQREAGVGQAIQQGLGLYGTDQQFGLAGRQQTEAERMGQFSRDLGTREFLSQDALRRDQQRESERSALAQEGMQRGALTGIYDGQRTLDQQRQDLAYRTGLAQTFGTDLGGDDTSRQTEARSQRLQQEAFQRAGLTGQLGDDRTLAAQQLYGSPEATTTLQGQELALRRGELLGKIDQERTLAAQEALGTVDSQDTLARDALQQQKDEAALDRTATEDQAGLNRDLARAELRGFEEIDGRRVQTLAAREAGAQRRLTESQAKLDRDARTTEAGLQRDLAREELYGGYTSEYDRKMRRVGTLAKTEGAAERQARADLQQAQFGQETSQAALQRSLAREELYGGVTTDYERAMGAKTLASSGQAADIAAENRRLAEMETAGVSQRGLAERELTQRAALASEQRALDREQLYGRAMTRAEQESGLGYSGGTLGAQQQAEVERAALISEGFEGRRVGVAEQARRDQVAQERQRMSLAEQELYGGADEISLDSLELDPDIEMGAGRSAAIEMALQQRLGRKPSRDEIASVAGGNSIRGRQTLAAQEAGEGRAFAAEQAALDRGLTRGESGLARELSREELAQRGTLAEADITSRERMAQEQRLLSREELYGTGDVSAQQGSTLAARQARQDLALRGELGRGQLEQDTRRTDLASAELYGTGDPRRQTGETAGAREARLGRGLEDRRLSEIERAGAAGTEAEKQRLRLASEELYGGAGVDPRMGTLASREAVSDRALRRQLGEGQLEQDTRRTDLARDELRGYSELYPGGMREDTAAVREGKAARGLEGRRMDEIERSALVSEQADRDRLGLAEEELYGGVGRRGLSGTTLASREAGLDREQRVLDRALDQERLDLAEEELYGGVGRRGLAGTTLASRESIADRESREGMAAADIASREGIASKGRALSREEIYGTGDSRQWKGDTLRRQQYDADQSRQNALDMRTALGMMQNLPEGYQPSEMEASVLSELLGRPDIARWGGGAASDLTDEQRAGYNAFGYELTGNAVPMRNPSSAGGGEGGGEFESTRQHNFMTDNFLLDKPVDLDSTPGKVLHAIGSTAGGIKPDIAGIQARVNADRASKGLPPITIKREGNRYVQVG